MLLPFWIRTIGDAWSVRIPFKLLALAGLISLAFNFPFSSIDLSVPLPWLDLLRAALRDGIVQPSAFFLTCAGAAALLRTALPSQNRAVFLLLASAGSAALIKLILSGPALPRLEDETGYYLQSLIFLKGALKAAALPELPALMDALRLPFTGQDGHSYYSLHLHGWPFVLALFGWIQTSAFANLLLSGLNVFLFYRLLSLHLNPAKWPALAALAVFSLSPLLLFLSGTYMAHTFALTLSMLLVHSHERISSTRSLSVNVLLAVLLALLAGALVFSRAQTLIPVLAALLGAGLLERGRISGKAAAILRACALVLGTAAGFFALRAYGGNFPGFPVNSDPCNAPGFGPGHGCFPTYGTLGHTLQKTLFNTGDLLSRWNQELALGGLPVALLAGWLFFRRFKQSLQNRSIVLYSLILAASIAQFGLFFHNGGESYHGRYLADSSFAMAMLLGLLLELECKERADGGESLWQTAGRMLLPAAVVLALTSPVLQIRGDYFHPHIEPFRAASRLTSVKNALIALDLPADGDVPSRDEFNGQAIVIPRKQVKSYLNLGYGTLAATAVRIGKEGIPEDADGNLLLGEMRRSDALQLAKALKRPLYVLKFNSFEPLTKSSRVMRFWQRKPPELVQVQSE